MLFRHFAKIALTAASFENRFFPRYFSISVIYNMPPKKKDEEKPTPLMGRFGTSLKCGIVGLPNVGKSTFFNVLTKSAAAAENFPFCTIDPNENRVAVPDERWDFLCEFHKPVSKVPAFLHVTDIAGLVQGAHEGQGLGNAFLSHIWACDAIFHMIRAFEGEDVTHVEGDVNPVRDLEIISEELRKKDEEYLKDKVNNMEKTVIRGGDKKRVGEYESLKKICHTVSEDKKHVRFVTWDAKEIEVLNKHLLLTSKPVIYLVNLSEKDYIRKKNKWLAKIKEWVDANDSGAVIIPFSGALESKLLDMEQEEAEKYLKEAGTQSALAKIITTGFKALQLQYFFTAGKDEVKAWTILKGTKAPQAAGKIHTDFEKGFIMAEVMKFEDFKEHGSEAAAKAAGKYKQEGKNYVVNDGDIIFFKFNSGAGLTDKKKVK
ncbi:obg-like ATPase 1 [Montipora foliosa]|uniref:obg-like ATPase 1 n=1 Tax=Montipora foliosa TaxID=591990 RepID=UPI0035F10A12